MADWYVSRPTNSPAGNDSTGTGAIGAPWATVAAALGKAAVVAGDRIYIRGGTGYTGWTCTKNNITFEGYPLETAVVQEAARANMVQFSGGISQGTLRNLTIIQQNTTTNGSAVFVTGLTGSPGVLIDHCRITDAPQYGIRSYDSNNVRVWDSEIARCGMGVEFHTAQASATSNAARRGQGSEVRRCWVHDMDKMIKATATPTTDDFGAIGVGLTRVAGTAAVPILIEDNLFERCFAVSPDYGYDGGCVEIFATGFLRVVDNFMIDSKQAWETGTQFISGTTGPKYSVTDYVITRNRITRDVTYSSGTPPMDYARGGLNSILQNAEVSHNTFYGLDQFGLSIGLSSPTDPYGDVSFNSVVRHNVVYAGPRAANDRCINYWQDLGAQGVVVDYNLYYHPAGASGQIAFLNFAATKGKLTVGQIQADSSYDDHSIQGNPLLANPQSRAVGLSSGSPALNVAPYVQALNSPYRGAGPDLGAIEGTVVFSDEFIRTQIDTWGNADLGGAWQYTGGVASGAYDADGRRGTMTGVAGATRVAYMPGALSVDQDVSAIVQTDRVPTGGSAVAYLQARTVGATDTYYARLEFTTAQAVNLGIFRWSSGGGEVALAGTAAPTVAIGRETHAAATDFNVRLQAIGTNPTVLRAKVWRRGTVEPQDWDRVGADSTAALQVASGGGLRYFLSGAASNTPSLAWDRVRMFSDVEGGLVNLARQTLHPSQRPVSVSITAGANVTVPLSRQALRLQQRPVTGFWLANLSVPLLRQVLDLQQLPLDLVGIQVITLERQVLDLRSMPLSLFGSAGADEDLVYDSGWITSATTDFTLPTEVLESLHRYRWQIDVEDTEGLAGTLV